MRVKMIGWMMEIFSKLNSKPETLFYAIDIMDEYLALTDKRLENEQIHLIGMTSIYMASKLNEVSPMCLKFVEKKLGLR